MIKKIINIILKFLKDINEIIELLIIRISLINFKLQFVHEKNEIFL